MIMGATRIFGGNDGCGVIEKNLSEGQVHSAFEKNR